MENWKKYLLLGFIFLTPISCEDDPENSYHFAESQITDESLLSNTMILASDHMEGRGTGTLGEDKAALYIAEQFIDAGLEPLGVLGTETFAKTDFQDYFQTVSLLGMKKVARTSQLEIKNDKEILAYEAGKSLAYWSSAQEPMIEIEAAPLIFVGYGVEAPEYNWDDLKGFDLKGKVLLFLNDDPPVEEAGVELFAGKERTYYGRWTYKFEQAMKHGADGALVIHTTESASYPFSVVQHSGVVENFALDLPNTDYRIKLLGWIDRERSEAIASSMGRTLQDLFLAASSRNFQPIDTGYRVTALINTHIRSLESKNVVGVLKGQDTILKNQLIVFSAHYDHMGTNLELDGDDKVFNGAWDNASGTACLLTLARAFSCLSERPRRSVAFLACTGEEKGLLGSSWFVSRPPLPLNKIVANYNIDMPQIFGVTTDIGAIGFDMNTLGDDLKRAARWKGWRYPYPLQIVGDTDPSAGRFYRSDQINFAKKGIPSLFIGPGTNYIEPLSFDPDQYRREHYHQVSDEVNEYWNLKGAERDMRVLFRAALRTCNKNEMPRWVDGSEFELAWEDLYKGF